MKKRDYVDSIIVTLPKKFFVEYSHEKYLEEIKHMTENPGEMIWYRDFWLQNYSYGAVESHDLPLVDIRTIEDVKEFISTLEKFI